MTMRESTDEFIVRMRQRRAERERRDRILAAALLVVSAIVFCLLVWGSN